MTVLPTSSSTHPAVAPVDADGLARALQPFGQSTMLPAAAYTDPAVLAWERRHFVAGTWACVGRTEDLAVDDAGNALSQCAVQSALG